LVLCTLIINIHILGVSEFIDSPHT
jgi:hypothetical protein